MLRPARIISVRKVSNNLKLKDTAYTSEDIWVLDTVGSNLLDILALDNIDVNRTTSNDIQETYKVLGIEAARQCIYNELDESFESYINDPNSLDGDDISNLLNISRNRFGKTLESSGYNTENMKLCVKFTDLICCMNDIIVNNINRN